MTITVLGFIRGM